MRGVLFDHVTFMMLIIASLCSDVCQAAGELLCATIRSPAYKPFAVLSDLRETWILLWLDRNSVLTFGAPSRSCAIGIIRSLLEKVWQNFKLFLNFMAYLFRLLTGGDMWRTWRCRPVDRDCRRWWPSRTPVQASTTWVEPGFSNWCSWSRRPEGLPHSGWSWKLVPRQMSSGAATFVHTRNRIFKPQARSWFPVFLRVFSLLSTPFFMTSIQFPTNGIWFLFPPHTAPMFHVSLVLRNR